MHAVTIQNVDMILITAKSTSVVTRFSTMNITFPNYTPWDDLSDSPQVLLRGAIPTAPIVGVCQPTSAQELATIVTQAVQANYAILPYGHGSKLDWGGFVGDDRSVLAVSTAGIDRLIEHAAADMTITVEAGMPFAALQAQLATAKQFLPVDPRFGNMATIGGVIATADSGSWRHRYSSLRDLVLGVSFVRSDGELVKAGGRVVKNVAGYDLMKLLAGSYGTLGIITQVTLRVYPIELASQTFLLTGSDAGLAQTAQELLNSVLTPTTIDWLAPATRKDGEPLSLVVRCQTVAESIEEQHRRLQAMAKVADVTIAPVLNEAAFWEEIGTIGTTGIVCKIGIKASTTVDVFQQIKAIAPGFGAIVHAGMGVGRLVLPAGTDPGMVNQVRSICAETGGFLTVLRGPIGLKQAIDIWGYTGNAVELMNAVKQQFDPQNCLSPGRFVGAC
jgi:glycolate oxidase FAD binding subunit